MAGVDGILRMGLDTRYFLSEVKSALAQAEKFDLKLGARSTSLPLGRITADVSRFNDSLAAANQRVLAFGASAGVIAGFTRSMSELATSTIQVEKAFADINSVFSLTNNELNKFKSQIFDVARNTAQSFETTAKAALEFSRQGLGVSETLERINQAQILSRLSGLEATKSVESLTAVLNAYKKEGLDAATVVNKLVAVDSKFAVSAGDLVEGLSRVGSTAQNVGVSFDSLVALITTAQQITARGGAEIGNGLKSIFTRLNRTDVLDQLEDFGIKVRDLGGDALAADKILQNIGNNFGSLSKQQQSVVAELSAGIFQIDKFRAIVSELSRSYNSYSNSLEVSKAATNEATLRNEALNKSLSSVLQNFRTSATEIGSIIGNLTFAEPLKNLLNNKFFGLIADQFKNIGKEGLSSGEQLGSSVAEGLLKGLGNVLSSSGGIVIASSLLKIIGKVGVTALKDLGGILSFRTNETKTLQGLNTVLGQATSLEQQRYLAAKNVAEQEQVILAILNRQVVAMNALRARNTSVLSEFSPTTLGTLKGLGKTSGRGFAGGFIPNLVSEESNAIKRGVGGAHKNAKPVIIPNFSFGGGQRGTAVANTSEYIVPNYAGGGSAIFNQDMVKSMGLPKGAKKINAAGGFSPGGSLSLSKFFGALGGTYKQDFFRLLKQDPKLGRFIAKTIDRVDPGAQRNLYGILGNYVQYTPHKFGLGTTSTFNLGASPEDIRKGIAKTFGNYGREFPFAGGFVPNFAGGKMTTLFRGLINPDTSKPLSSLLESSSKIHPEVNSFNDLMGYLYRSKAYGTQPGLIPTSRSFRESKYFSALSKEDKLKQIKDFSSSPENAFLVKKIKEKNIFKDPKRLEKVFNKVGGVQGLLKLNKSVGGLGIDSDLISKYFENDLGKMSNLEFLVTEKEVTLLENLFNAKVFGKASSGFIPNFAKKLLDDMEFIGSGAYGDVYKINNKNLVFKSFERMHALGRDIRDAELMDEYASSKMMSSLGLPVAKTFGSAKRSLQRGGIFKEYIEGSRGDTLPPLLDLHIRRKLLDKFAKKGVFLNDLHSGNYIVKGGFSNDKTIKSLLENAVVVDAGGAIMGKPSLQKEYRELFKLPFAGGYLPSNLSDAIEREKSAGLSSSQVYVDSDPRIRSSGNPLGLLVANRRDEPIGGHQGVTRAIAQGLNPKLVGMASGFIPNFADESPFKKADLRTSTGTFVSASSRKRLDKALETYSTALLSGSKNLATSIKNQISEIDLNRSSIAFVKDMFDLEADTIKASAKAKEKAIKDEEKLLKQWEKEYKAEIIAKEKAAQQEEKLLKQWEKEYNQEAKANAKKKAAEEKIIKKQLEAESFIQKQSLSVKNAPIFYGGKGSQQDDFFKNFDTKPGQLIIDPNEIAAQAKKASTFSKITDLEKSLKKSITGVTNQAIGSILDQIGSSDLSNLSRKGKIKNIREGAFSEPAINKDGGRRTVNPNRVDAVLALSGAETFSQQFEKSVKGLVNQGDSLRDAYLKASRSIVYSGASSRQLGQIQESLAYDLAKYEKSVLEAKAETEKGIIESRNFNSKKLNLRRIESELVSGKDFDSLSRKDQSTLRGSLRRQSIQELGLDPNGISGNKKAISAINSLVAQKIENIRNPLDQKTIITQLKQQTKLFGNYEETAKRIISKGGFSSTQAESILGTAQGLRANRAAKLQNFGFTAAFALPLAGGLVESLAGPAEGGTGKAKAIGSISGGSQGVGIGATIGSLFGPIGTAIGGALGGAIGAVIGYTDRATKSFEELAQATQAVESANSRLLDGLNQYANAQQNINDAISSGADPEKLQSLRKAQLRVEDLIPAKYKRELALAGSNMEEIFKIITRASEDANDQLRKSQTVSSFGSIREKPTKENIETAAALVGAQVGNNVDISKLTEITKKFNSEENTSARSIDFLNQLGSAATGMEGGLPMLSDSFREASKSIVSASDAIKEFESVIKQSSLSSTQQKEIIDQLKSTDESKVGETFAQIIKTLQENKSISASKQSQSDFQAASVNIAKEINKAVAGLQQVLSNNAIVSSYSERFRSANFDAFMSTGVLNENQRTAAQSQENLRVAKASADEKRTNALIDTQAKILSSLTKERASSAFGGSKITVAEAFSKAVTADQLEDVIRTAFGAESFSSESAKELRNAVSVLRNIENSTNAEVDLTTQLNGLMETQTRIGQQQRFLQSGRFDARRLQSLDDARVLGASRGASDIFRANSQLDFSQGLDSLGIVQGRNTLRFQRELQRISSTGTLSRLSSDLLGRRVGTDEDSLRSAGTELMGSSDRQRRDAGERILATLDALSIDIEAEAKKFRNADPTANIQALIQSGKITIGEEALTSGVNKTAENTYQATVLLKELNNLLAQQEDATLIRDLTVQLEGSDKKISQLLSQKGAIPDKVIDNAYKEKENIQNQITEAKKRINERNVDSSLKSFFGKLDANGQKISENTTAQNSVVQSSTELTGSNKELQSKIVGRKEDGTNTMSAFTTTTASIGSTEVSKFGEFGQGFKSILAPAKDELQTFYEEGKIVADSLKNNLGNAFGDFVTGAKSGKDAFRDFVLNVLNDAARAFASQAVTRLLGSFFGGPTGANRGGPIGRNRGGNIPRFASGGTVPALLTGGEYVLDAASARALGPSFLSQLNNGTLPHGALQGTGSGMNSYGMVSGGSGLRDDVPASLQPGSYVIKKASVNKYGMDALNTLNSGGRVQRKFWGGALLGALLGGGIGYATGGKKGALIGALGGGLAGGFAQNQGWLKGIGLDKASSIAKVASGGGSGNLSALVEGATGQQLPSSLAAEVAKKSSIDMLKQSMLGLGISAALALATRASTNSNSSQSGRAMTAEEITAERIRLENEQSELFASNLSQQRYAYLSPDLNSVSSFGAAPATRRFNTGGMVHGPTPNFSSPFASVGEFSYGGPVSPIVETPRKYFNGGPVTDMASPLKFANGGPVVNDNMGKATNSLPGAPTVNISVTINNEGGNVTSESTSSVDTDSDLLSNKEFGLSLSAAIEKKVNEAIADQYRNGGTFQQLSRQK